MTLDELNRIQDEAKQLEFSARVAKASQERYAAIRTGDRALWVEMTNGSLLYNKDDHSFLQGVINEMAPEILRLAEMRKAAYERECKAKAAALNAALESFLINSPSKELP